MTEASLRVTSLLPEVEPTQTWEEYLLSNLDNDWRPGEWNANEWVFIPNPDNPNTALVRCARVGCERTFQGGPRQPLCPTCLDEAKATGVSPSEIAQQPKQSVTRTGRQRRQRRASLPRCAVSVRGIQCGQDADTTGAILCQSHQDQWQETWRSDVRFRSRDAWLAAVTAGELEALPYARQPCDTPLCQQSAWAMEGTTAHLCALCAKSYNDHVRSGDVQSVDEWLRSFSNPYTGLPTLALSLIGSDTARIEFLYAIQQLDKTSLGSFYVARIRQILGAVRRKNPESLLDDLDWLRDQGDSQHVTSIANRLADILAAALRRFNGYDARTADLLYLNDLPLRTLRSSPELSRQIQPLDLTTIPQPWLREAFRTWVLSGLPPRRDVNVAYAVARSASTTLMRTLGAASLDGAEVGLADMTAIVNGFHSDWTTEGAAGPNKDTMKYVLRFWWEMCDLARRTQLWDDIPATFAHDPAVHRNNGFAIEEDDELGRALPNDVVKHLRNSTHLIEGETADLQRAILEVLIDTGRRPTEVVHLRRDCLKQDADGGWSLEYDNSKSRRAKRRLPVNQETVDAIQRWLPVLDRQRPGCDWLFPSPIVRRNQPIKSSTLGTYVANLVDAAPPMTSPVIGVDGEATIFDTETVTPYDFRHSYAQRHADAGVAPDALRQLMDHKNISTTMGYYRVTQKRKRDAARMIAPLTRDRDGRPVGITEGRQQLATVAVPFGGCAEPSNVQAGGNDCPVRFQCSGCNFYRPDPSYIPDLERHVADLRMNLAAARRMDSPSYVLANFDGQIADYVRILDQMKSDLAELPQQQRQQVEEASSVLRRARIAEASGLTLSIEPVRSERGGDE